MTKTTAIPDEVSIDDFAKLVGVTQRTVRNYVQEGTVTSGGRGKVLLNPSIRNLIDAAKVARPDSQLDKARARALDARTRAQEIKTAREEGRLMEFDEAMALVEDLTGLFVSAIESVPARFTRDMKVRLNLEKVVFDVREEVSKEMAKRADELRNEVTK